MKKLFTILILFALTSFSGWAQSVSFTAVPTSTPVGTSITISYKYTIASAGKLTCGINLFDDWTYISTVNYTELNPAIAGTDVVGSFTILIPSGTAPTTNLTGLQNYKINLELKDASNNWLAGDYSVQNYNFTAVVTPAVSFTAVATSTTVGTSINISYKYTIGSAGKLVCGINLYDDWTYISTVNYTELNPAVSGTDVVGSFTILIPSGTKPTASLTGMQNYKINLQLQNSSGGYLTDVFLQNYNFTVMPAVSFTSVPTSTPVGTSLNINYKYTIGSAGKLVCGINLYDDWTYISTVNYTELNPAISGTDVVGSFTILIPSGTTAKASLTGMQNYKINLQLQDSSGGWLAEDFLQNYDIIVPITPVVTFDPAPISTEVGTDLVVNYKYSNATPCKVICKIELYADWTWISTVNAAEITVPAGTNLTGSLTIPIPVNTLAKSGLPLGQNYRVILELKDTSDNYLAGDYSVGDYNLTSLAPAVSFNPEPTSTEVGTDLVVNYKYSNATPCKVICKIELYADWTWISTVNAAEITVPAGTNLTGSLTIPIPICTAIKASLPPGQNYRVILELKDNSDNYLTGNYSVGDYNLKVTTAPSTWLGGTSTNWSDATNWSTGLPNSLSDVTIPCGYSNQPVIASNITINSLTIASGVTLIVNEGKVLNVAGAITNSGDLILKSSAVGSASLLSTVAAPNVTQQRYCNSNQRGWRLVSNPLSTITFGTLSTNSTTPITLGTNASGAYASATNTWVNSTDTDNMVSQQAYKIFLRGIASEVTNTSYSVSPPSNVILAIKGTASNTAPATVATTAGQYYLIANPYTAPVSLYSILGASPGLSTTVSYYNPTIGSSGSNTDLIVKYGGYENHTIAAVTQGDANDVILPPMGAIFVQAVSVGTINIPKTAIFTGTALGGSYNHKTAQSKVFTTNALKLELRSNGTYYDAVAFHFKEVGNAGSNVDFGKLPNTILNFYSINGSNSMAVLEVDLKDQIIPLGITSTKQKSYTLHVTENSIPIGFVAELRDNVLNTKTVLTRGSSYNFDIDSTPASQGNDRFAINLKASGTLSVEANELYSKLKLWPNPAENQFNISNTQNSEDGVTSIQIMTATGQLIHSQKLNPGIISKIQTNGWASGVYILKATNNKSETTKKLIIQ